MQTKTCRGCDIEKPITAFYKHPEMADGHLNYCKECRKAYERERRAQGCKAEYERRRYRDPSRKAYIQAIAQAWARRFPGRRRAQAAVNNALRGGRLERGTECSQCGGEGHLEAHHEDYGKPLDVTWLCIRCHRRLHLAVDP